MSVQEISRIFDKLRALNVNKYKQSFPGIVKDVISDLKVEMQKDSDDVEPGRVHRLKCMVDKLTCFNRRNPYVTVVPPPHLDEVPSPLRTLTRGRQTPQKFSEVMDYEEAAVKKMASHLLDDVQKHDVLSDPECKVTSKGVCKGTCAVQTSHVSSLAFEGWPTAPLIVPCVTRKTKKFPLYTRETHIVVSLALEFQSPFPHLPRSANSLHTKNSSSAFSKWGFYF